MAGRHDHLQRRAERLRKSAALKVLERLRHRSPLPTRALGVFDTLQRLAARGLVVKVGGRRPHWRLADPDGG